MLALDPQVHKWTKWLEPVEQDIAGLLQAQDIFWSVQALVKAQPAVQDPALFHHYLARTFVAYTLMGVRRQVKIHKDSISIMKLLREISQHPSKLSRTHYLGLWVDKDKLPHANSFFDRFTDSPGGPHISRQSVERDIQELRSAAITCEDVADKRIAHYDRDPPGELTFRQLAAAISTLEKLTIKYCSLLLASSPVSLLPIDQTGWQRVFDHPWRKS